MASSKCPYCDGKLEEKPTRKKKCPHCGNYILIRNGKLLTEEQAIIIDWIKRLDNLGLTEKEFDIHKKALTKQFGKTPSINDTIWRFLNTQLVKSVDSSRSKFVYLEMARLVRIEGRDPKPYLAEAAKVELIQLKKTGTTKVKVYTCNDNFVCSKCRELENRVFTINEALKKMFIPNSCQNEDGCRCWYIPAN